MKILKKILVSCVILFSIGTTMAEPSTVYTVDKPAIIVQFGQPVFSIKLKSNPTTGYSWYLREYDSNMIQPVRRAYEAPGSKKLVGASGFEVWTFRVKSDAFIVPRQTLIRFVYARPWEADGKEDQVVFHVTTQVKE